jgi:hypothetical protein
LLIVFRILAASAVSRCASAWSAPMRDDSSVLCRESVQMRMRLRTVIASTTAAASPIKMCAARSL